MEYLKKKRKKKHGKKLKTHSRETKALVTVIVYLTLNQKRTKENIA